MRNMWSGARNINTPEALELVLAGFSSNTALSLNKVSLSGWVFDCNITEKTGMMQSLIQVFKNSRISCLDLSSCHVKLGCNQRQFTLYFEMDDPCKSRSLWHEIHDEKVVSTTLKSLILRDLKISINSKRMCLHQELSMLSCPNLKNLDVSCSPIFSSDPPDTIFHLFEILSGLPPPIITSLETLTLDNHLLYQHISSSQAPALKELLARLENLTKISFAGGAFVSGTTRQGKEDMIKFCIDNIYGLEDIGLENTHLSKEQGLALSRAVKSKAKRGYTMNIGTKGTTGSGVSKMMTIISLSKFVFSEFDDKTGIVTVQRV